MTAKVSITNVEPNTSDFGISGSQVIVNQVSGELYTRTLNNQVKRVGADSAFTPSGIGARSDETVQAALRRFVWASQYGSGMTTTPGADVNAAITALGSTGGIVYLPGGSFSVETSILQPSNISLVGQGIGVTVLNAKTGLNGPVIKNATAFTSQTITVTRTGRTATATKTAHGYSNGTWVFINGANQLGYNGVFQVFNVTANTFDFYVEQTTTSPATGTIRVFQASNTKLAIRSLEIVGNASNTVGDNYGIQYSGVENFCLEDLYVHGTTHMGVGFWSAANGTLTRCRSDEVINSSHNGFLLGSSTGGAGGGFSYCANIVLQDCRADQCGQTGLEIFAGRNFVVSNFIGLRNVAGAVTLSDASQAVFKGCLGRWNGLGLELFLGGGASDITITDCVFNENGGAGIQISQNDTVNTSSRIVIANNVCSYNGQVAGGTPYGITIENPALAVTLDQVVIEGNLLSNNGRGLSFSANGTMTNVTVTGNRGINNTVDIVFGAVDLATLEYGQNRFANFTDGFTFTPVLTFATPGDLAVTYSQQFGRYSRNGGVVTIWVNILTSAFTFTTASGSLKITGLPFAALNVANLTQLGGGCGWRGITKAGFTDVNPFILANTSIINFSACGSAQALAVIATADMPTGGTVQLTFQMSYRINEA